MRYEEKDYTTSRKESDVTLKENNGCFINAPADIGGDVCATSGDRWDVYATFKNPVKTSPVVAVHVHLYKGAYLREKPKIGITLILRNSEALAALNAKLIEAGVYKPGGAQTGIHAGHARYAGSNTTMAPILMDSHELDDTPSPGYTMLHKLVETGVLDATLSAAYEEFEVLARHKNLVRIPNSEKIPLLAPIGEGLDKACQGRRYT